MTWALTGEAARAVIEPDFQQLPLAAVSEAALHTARALGAQHADVRHADVRYADARPAGEGGEPCG